MASYANERREEEREHRRSRDLGGSARNTVEACAAFLDHLGDPNRGAAGSRSLIEFKEAQRLRR